MDHRRADARNISCHSRSASPVSGSQAYFVRAHIADPHISTGRDIQLLPVSLGHKDGRLVINSATPGIHSCPDDFDCGPLAGRIY